MRRVELDGSSPEAFNQSLHDLIDAKFEDDFLYDPARNTVANTKADNFSDIVIDIFEGPKPDAISAGTVSRFHFGVKKLVFLFTNPEDTTDSLEDNDLERFLTVMLQEANSIEEFSEVINSYANYAFSLYFNQVKEASAGHWNQLSQTQKFWAVYGAAVTGIEKDLE